MTNLNENDLNVIGRIQEARGCTIAKAKEMYRAQAMKLADPDIANRHEVIWDNFQRGSGESAGKQTKEQKRMATKTSTKPRAAAKKPKAEARPTVELAELTREIELTPVGADEFKHIHTGNLFGKKHAVIVAEIDHGRGVEDRFGFIQVSAQRLKDAIDYGKQNDLPVAIAAIVRVKGRLDQGYAIPKEVFDQFKMDSKHALTLSGKARLAYREKGWDGCKFTVSKAEQVAA